MPEYFGEATAEQFGHSMVDLSMRTLPKSLAKTTNIKDEFTTGLYAEKNYQEKNEKVEDC